MPEPFLCEQRVTLFRWGNIKKGIPDSVAQNLNQRYELRPYQARSLCALFSLLQRIT